jgi:hypothetical protein
MKIANFRQELGFLDGPSSTLISRSLLLTEACCLFSAIDPDTNYNKIKQQVLEENVLGKLTQGSRFETFRRMREFFGLNPHLPVYATMIHLWNYDEAEQPLLTFLCATARDQALRKTSSLVLSCPFGKIFPKNELHMLLQKLYQERYNPDCLARMTTNIIKSWTDAGFLRREGSLHKRKPAYCGPAATTYALFLGYLEGRRGQELYQSLWSNLLDAPLEALYELTFQASRLGWLDYKNAGGIVEIKFHLPSMKEVLK